jgi:opacity protein-like surface antigen
VKNNFYALFIICLLFIPEMDAQIYTGLQIGHTYNMDFVKPGTHGNNYGISAGINIYSSADKIYNLDLELGFDYYYRRETEMTTLGSGQIKHKNYILDFMPIHRLKFNDFLLSPFFGAGISIKWDNATYSLPPEYLGSTNKLIVSSKAGLLLFYGLQFNVSDDIIPYLSCKAFYPFGKEKIEFGAGRYEWHDVPGYNSFSIGAKIKIQ